MLNTPLLMMSTLSITAHAKPAGSAPPTTLTNVAEGIAGDSKPSFITSDARAALPGQYSKSDTIHNIGHALAVVEALREGDLSLLASAMADRVHEPYRVPLIPGAAEAKRQAMAAGAATTCLSGAGPGMLAISKDNHDAIGAAMCQAFADSGIAARHWVLETLATGTEISSC